MRRTKLLLRATAWGLVVAATAAASSALAAPAPDTTVEVKGVHLCCGACVKGVATALKDVEGVTPKCDKDHGTVTLTAKNEDAVKRALSALGAAGYFGETRSPGLAITPPSVAKGKVKSLALTGVHNCCGSCCKAIKAAVKVVPGVSGDTAKPKSDRFEVTGDFEPAALIDALNAAGFNATIAP